MRRIMVSQAVIWHGLCPMFSSSKVGPCTYRRCVGVCVMSSPSIVPGVDRDVHLVLDDFGRSGDKLHKPKKEASVAPILRVR